MNGFSADATRSSRPSITQENPVDDQNDMVSSFSSAGTGGGGGPTRTNL